MTIIKTTLSLTEHDCKWMDRIISSGEYVSSSEYVRNFIRQDKERRIEPPAQIAYIRTKLIESEQNGFADQTADEILKDFKDELRNSGKL